MALAATETINKIINIIWLKLLSQGMPSHEKIFYQTIFKSTSLRIGETLNNMRCAYKSEFIQKYQAINYFHLLQVFKKFQIKNQDR